jgi:protein ImuB
VADAWEHVLGRLESIGAAVDSPRPGIVSFAVQGLRGIHGGRVEGVLEAARRTLRTGGPGGAGARLGAAPTPFCSLAAAVRARPRRDEIVRGDAAAYLAPRKVALLRAEPGPATLVQPLERLGILTLGELAGLPRDAVADRFGAVGLHAHDLASGRELPLHPRRPGERVSESLELPEAASGLQLQRAVDVLVDRLLARSDRRARTLRAVTVSARLVEGGTWRERVPFREATADPARIRLALTVPLGRLPAPAAMLALTVEDFGPPAADQRALIGEEDEERRRRLREAVRHLRAAGGSDAALRVLLVDEGSRVPERRSLLTPFEP